MAEEKTFAVVGPPGSGKSTLLNILAVTYAEDKADDMLGFKESRLPLFLPLKHLPSDLKPLPQILSELLQNAGCSVKNDFVRQQLENGRCIVILDGLDETGDNTRRIEVAEWIMKSISAFPDNRFIVSCRTTEWELVRIPSIPYAHILKLSSDEIQGIVKNWEKYFTAKSNHDSIHGTLISKTLTDSILRSGNRDLRQLAETPLLLTIMVILHLNNVDVPERKVEVYEVFMRTLLGEWDEVKNLGIADIQNRTENRLLFFQSLCLYLLENEDLKEELNLEIDHLVSFITNQLESIFGQCIQISTFLESIAARSGLIYEIGNNRYGFAARGFLAFLAARALFNTRDYGEIVEHATQEEWYESIVQFIDFLQDATAFSEKMLEVQPEHSVLYYRILAHVLLSERFVERSTKEKILQHLRGFVIHQCIPNALANADLIKESYAIEPEYWLELFSEEIIKSSGLIGTRQICETFVIVDDPIALDRLISIAMNVSNEVDLEIARALRFSPQPKSIDALWGLLGNEQVRDTVYDTAIDSLSAKGDEVIPSCKNILKETSYSESVKRAAISVLCRINNPEVIPYLLEITASMKASIHRHVAEELHKNYFGKYGFSNVQKILSGANSKNLAYVHYFKRAIDIFLSLPGLSVLVIVSPLVALGTKLYSPGPIFYKQTRIGKDGKLFHLFHFRTMALNVEREATSWVWVSRDDPRITPIGMFLRRTRLDVLPEYLNVLRGDMSVIGPQPKKPEFHQIIINHIPSYNTRLDLRPGVTGLAQVNYEYGGSVTDATEEFLYDLYYVSHCSFYLDLKIMFKTVQAVWRLQGY